MFLTLLLTLLWTTRSQASFFLAQRGIFWPDPVEFGKSVKVVLPASTTRHSLSFIIALTTKVKSNVSLLRTALQGRPLVLPLRCCPPSSLLPDRDGVHSQHLNDRLCCHLRDPSPGHGRGGFGLVLPVEELGDGQLYHVKLCGPGDVLFALNRRY